MPTAVNDFRPVARDLRRLQFATIVPFAALAGLYLARVPLGKPGKFTYLYAQLVGERALNALYVLPCAALAGWAVYRLALSPKKGALVSWLILMMAGAGLAVWCHVGVPMYQVQHVFNLASPSHDGAFIWEADRTDDLGAYLRNFPAYLSTPAPRWGGTRVISNPPGTTLLAYQARRMHEAWPNLARQLAPDLPESARRNLHMAVLFSYLLSMLFFLAALPWALWARSALSAAGAAVFVICTLFSPMTILFTPGKDTAQMASVGLLVWLTLAAWNRRSIVLASASGAAALLGTMFSLVHLWVGLILILATGWRALRSDGRSIRRWLLLVLAASATFGSLCLCLWSTAGIDVYGILRAVVAGQAEVTRGPGAMPLAWQALGIPLFLLFAGPALWFCALSSMGCGERLHDEPARLGRSLILITVTVMMATVGFTNIETPRLWLPFGALLMVGASLQMPAFRDATSPRAGTGRAWLLGWLVFAQVAGSVAPWICMDMREAESRLIEINGNPRYFW